jgi:hypothetical protein
MSKRVRALSALTIGAPASMVAWQFVPFAQPAIGATGIALFGRWLTRIVINELRD